MQNIYVYYKPIYALQCTVTFSILFHLFFFNADLYPLNRFHDLIVLEPAN